MLPGHDDNGQTRDQQEQDDRYPFENFFESAHKKQVL
jgi:hypothetical protein